MIEEVFAGMKIPGQFGAAGMARAANEKHLLTVDSAQHRVPRLVGMFGLPRIMLGHGPMAEHNTWQTKHPNQSGDPMLRRINREQMFFVCGSCHSRRAELTGDFHPGENFFDHYALTIPDETDLFYPDGQVRDEDYEFTSFLGSRMRAAGVRCIDCHEPHSARTRVA